MNDLHFNKLTNVHVPLIQTNIRLKQSQIALENALRTSVKNRYDENSLNELFITCSEVRTSCANLNSIVVRIKELVWTHQRQDPEHPEYFDTVSTKKASRFKRKRAVNKIIYDQKGKLPVSLYRALMDNGKNYQLSRLKKGQKSGVKTR